MMSTPAAASHGNVPGGGPPGIAKITISAASAAAGTQPISAPRSPVQVTWRSDAPRARINVSSGSRRNATIRPAIASTTAAVSARLAASSACSVSSPLVVARNSCSGCCRPVLMVSAADAASRSPGSTAGSVVTRLSASYSAWAWSPWIPLTVTGTCQVMFSRGPRARCSARTSAGATNTAPIQ